MKKHREPSPAFTKARELAKHLSEMTDAERLAIAQRIDPRTIEGHALSTKNAGLLFMQLESATVIGGFKQWIGAGRCVAKGSSALWIFAPTTHKNDEGETETRFRLVPVFDVSQTAPLEA